MKTFQAILALAMTMSIGIQCCSQFVSGHIDSVRMVPPEPTTNDTINVIVFNSFPSSGCSITRRIYTQNLPFINNTTQYCIGMLTMMCYDSDTVKILPLPAGSYFLHYRIETADFSAGCNPYHPADSAGLQIDVSGPASAGNLTGGESIFKVIYDQNRNGFILYLNKYSGNHTVVIRDVLGKEIYRSRLHDLRNEIPCKWGEGIYLVTVFNDKARQTRKVIIKSNH